MKNVSDIVVFGVGDRLVSGFDDHEIPDAAVVLLVMDLIVLASLEIEAVSEVPSFPPGSHDYSFRIDSLLDDDTLNLANARMQSLFYAHVHQS